MKLLTTTLCLLIFTTTTACQDLRDNLSTTDTPVVPTQLATALKGSDRDEITPNAPTQNPPTATVSTTPELPPIPEPPQTSIDLRPQYTITAILDYGWRTLSVVQEVIIPNTSSDTISELIMVVQTNWRPDVFVLTDFTLADGAPVASYTLDGIRLRALLLEPLEPGEAIELSLSYEISIPPILTSEEFGPNPFGYTSRQTNLTDWYPFVPPYVDGVGWLVHNPWFYGEHLVYPVADFDVTIQLTNAPDGIVIAASALDEGEGNIHRYQMASARNFVWSVSPEYRVFEARIGKTTVLGYAFPYDVVPGEAAFNTTVEALELYNQLFGPYPFEGMSMIQADFEHGMEYSGLYFLSKAFYNTYDGTPSTYLAAIAAHETAHQWWYGLVGNDQALEPWLDEALCTYSEKLYYENLHPQNLGWWETYRVNYYEPAGWVDSNIYNTSGYRPYRDAVYLNGALFLDELRTLVGDEVFFDFLRDYLSRNTNKIANANDFFASLRDHTDVDWSKLLMQYFENVSTSE